MPRSSSAWQRLWFRAFVVLSLPLMLLCTLAGEGWAPTASMAVIAWDYLRRGYP